MWHSALLTAAPRVSPARIRLRARDRLSVWLLVRAAHVLGVACGARAGRGFQIVHAEGRGVIAILSTVRPAAVPVAA